MTAVPFVNVSKFYSNSIQVQAFILSITCGPKCMFYSPLWNGLVRRSKDPSQSPMEDPKCSFGLISRGQPEEIFLDILYILLFIIIFLIANIAKVHNIDLTDAVSSPSTSIQKNACIHQKKNPPIYAVKTSAKGRNMYR